MHGLVARVGGRLCVVRVVSVVRIAYLGPEGTFTEAALVRMVAAGLVPETGPDALQRMPVESAPAALAAVRDGGADYACVPIENSIDGSVLPTLDSLAIGVRLQVFAETTLDVTFSIVVKPGRNAADVRTLAAFPVAAAQVRQWLAAHLPAADLRPAYSNADAARQVADGLVDAAVTSPLAAARWGLAPWPTVSLTNPMPAPASSWLVGPGRLRRAPEPIARLQCCASTTSPVRW